MSTHPLLVSLYIYRYPFLDVKAPGLAIIGLNENQMYIYKDIEANTQQKTTHKTKQPPQHRNTQ